MPHHRRRVQIPPANELETRELAHALCHQLLPGPTTTSLLYDELIHREATGLPRSWLIQAHKAARRRQPDDETEVDNYIHHSDGELLASLSVKLDFDLEETRAALEDGNRQPILEALYSGLRKIN